MEDLRLVMAGVASLDRVAQDGIRVRASAGGPFRRHGLDGVAGDNRLDCLEIEVSLFRTTLEP